MIAVAIFKYFFFTERKLKISVSLFYIILNTWNANESAFMNFMRNNRQRLIKKTYDFIFLKNDLENGHVYKTVIERNVSDM